MATLISRLRESERGQAVIEMALTLPLLLMVVFGIIDFGFMFQRYEVITNAAREGARLGVLPQYTPAEASNRVQQYLLASGLPATTANRRGTCGGAQIKNTWCATLTPSTVTVPGSTPAKTVNQVTMLVQFDHEYSFLGPIMGLFGGSWGTIRLAAASSMRVE
jgi:Flp pilus assembly protein TadG